MAEQEQNRSEPATPFKLQEARRRGQVARSLELSSWLMLAVATALGWTLFEELSRDGLKMSRALLDQAGRVELTLHSARHLLTASLESIFAMFGVLLVVVFVAALASGFLQVGPVFSFHPLKPDFTRLNPATGFKRLFNVRLVYEAVKTIIKLALIVAVLYVALRGALPSLMVLPAVAVEAHPLILHRQILDMAMSVLAVLGLVAAFDLAFVKWEFAKKMRMSRRELREEVKRRDGDPKIKAKIRELQREAARRGASIRRVPGADVLITNPTHLSVAIKYERGKDLAPLVIAKGSGEMALRMRRRARQSGVPVLENRPLARLLFRAVPIDAAVPPESYPQVAAALMWVYRHHPRSG